MLRIDAHQHFWQYDPVRDAWINDGMAVLRQDFLPADLGPLLAANGIDGCVAVQADQSERETRFLLDLARDYPFIRGVVGWVDLRSPQVGERLAHFADDRHFRGVRHLVQGEPDDEFLLQPDVVRGIGALTPLGLTYDLLLVPRQLRAATQLAAMLPDQRFVLDHIAKPPIKEGVLEPWASDLGALALHPNVYCKLSGLITEAEWGAWKPAQLRQYLDVVVESFGVDRLMWGSDWPVCLLAGSYHEVREVIAEYLVRFSVDERSAIFGGNAATCYGLEG
ncbi:MAG: amidohydrolase family protein [Gemmatimonadetes bacterium]|jgi:L-fuconolactonase|nr:amidohydrolase family protein [Gemmatimonadota bacterium]MBP7620380.1 amidohydrolase family protein [Gemmatimonadales bacterium]